jgi:hypothetical protein
MAIWEYKTIDLNEVPARRSDIDVLDDAGKDGWVLVLITANRIAYLKREGREPAPSRSRQRRSATSVDT